MSWKEDVWNQVRHCACCHEPMLLSDWMKEEKKAYRSIEWLGNLRRDINVGTRANHGRTTCIQCKKINRQRTLMYEEKKVFVDTEYVKNMLIAVRERLGLTDSGTPSTYDGWEFLTFVWESFPKGGISVDDTMMSLFDYLRTTKKSSMLNDWERFYTGSKSQGRQKTVNIAYLIYLIDALFPGEVQVWPLWKLNHRTSRTLKNDSVVTGDMLQFNTAPLFDKMLSEIYGDNPTFDDIKDLMDYDYYRNTLQKKYPWLPTARMLFAGSWKGYDGDREVVPPIYESTWDFVDAFQMHFCESHILNLSDYKILYDTQRFKEDIGIVDGRHWFFNYLCPELDLDIIEDDFPFTSSASDLQQVINITVDELYKIDGGITKARKLANALMRLENPKEKTYSIGIKKIVEILWPEYGMEQNLWNRMLVGEKKMSEMLFKVMTHSGKDYRWDDTMHIPTRTGKVARYRHSRQPMRIDGISLNSMFIVEGQGDYHYGPFGQGSNWHKAIPKCYNGKARTYTEYRQELDAKCKRAIKRHGFTPIYVILSQYAMPVKGVHGAIPQWNRRYVTGRSTECIGLAETFDMQGREDIGDMIRDYYHNVVLNEEE